MVHGRCAVTYSRQSGEVDLLGEDTSIFGGAQRQFAAGLNNGESVKTRGLRRIGFWSVSVQLEEKALYGEIYLCCAIVTIAGVQRIQEPAWPTMLKLC
jgi:hypothetical protein